MADSYNPFAPFELRFPKSRYEEVTWYTRTRADAGGSSSVQTSPFDRYVDLWFFAVCLGAREGPPVELDREQTQRFERGVLLQGSPDRILLLEILAVTHSQDPYIVSEPRRVIDIANGFAAAGLPLALDMLAGGYSSPLANIVDGLNETIG